MKGRKMLAFALALILCLGLAVPALGAETAQNHNDFDDLRDESWSWAWPTVDDAIRRGLFVGYAPTTDEEGNTIVNFGPGDDVTVATGLTLCARMMLEKSLREEILADRLDQMRRIFPGTLDNPDDTGAPFVWFRREAAVCLELGIIDVDELEFLRDSERLGAAMNKAEFAKYLVRAMGLEDFAKGLNASELPFSDDSRIGREYRPYVNLLTTYGVLAGDENGNFNPTDSMSRAVCATMLSRAAENIKEERDVTIDLPKYTSYDYIEGYIRSVTLQDDGSRVMVLDSDITGLHTVNLPAAVSIYQYNMKAGTAELKEGTFARACYQGDTVTMVRLTPAGLLSQIEGSCDAITADSVMVNGVSYTIDRFTEVSAGGKTGDSSVIDLSAAYTSAQLVTNGSKGVLSLALTGGTREVEGILTDVTTVNLGSTTKTTATVTAFSGLPSTYVIGESVSVSVGGRETDSLKETFRGRRVVLRVSDEDVSQLVSVAVDTDSTYAQGILSKVRTNMTPTRVEVNLTGGTKPTPYELDDECVITYEGNPAQASTLPLGTFVTVKVDGGTATMLSAWTGMETVEGVVDNISYADPTVIRVVKTDDTTSEFSIPVADLGGVTILINHEDGDITKVKKGDSVSITLSYNKVTQIDVTPRSADVAGTLDSVTFNADNSAVVTIRFVDGSTQSYTVSPSATVTRSDQPVAISELVNARGLVVSIVTEGEEALSIQFAGTSTARDVVEGQIFNKSDQDRTLSILVTNQATGATSAVNVHVAMGVKITTTAGADMSNTSRLQVGDTIQAYGSYGTDGVFEATLVICK